MTKTIEERVAAMSPTERAQLIALATPRTVDPYFVHVPHPKQQIFLSLNNREALYGGAAGGGKSDALLMAASQYVDVPGYSALILRRTWPDLNSPGAILDRAKTWWSGSDVKITESGRIFVWPSGARIQFGYMSRENDKFKFQCFTPDHDLLTADGWKNITEVTTYDMVASVDPLSRVMTYEHVDRVFDYDFDGELVDVFQENGVSFKVTPNHTVWCGQERDRTLRPVRADELTLTATIPQFFQWECAEPNGKSFQTSTGGPDFTPEQWLKFLAWFTKCGKIDIAGGRWEIRIKPRADEFQKMKEDLSAINGLRWRSDDTYCWANSKLLFMWISEHLFVGHTKKRKMPDLIWNLDGKWAGVLLDTLVGSRSPEHPLKNRLFLTSSKQLADDVMRLAVHAGLRPTLAEHHDELYEISISIRTRDTTLRTPLHKKQRATFRKRTKYTGKVHCVETHPHHTLVIRHRGRVSLSGNSAEYQFVGFDELTQFPETMYTYMFSRVRRPRVSCLNCHTELIRHNGVFRHKVSNGCYEVFPDPKVLQQYQPSPSGLSIFNIPLRVRSATNPGGPGHDWVKERFVDVRTRRHNALFVPASLRDNPSLDEDSYRESLEFLLPADRERLLNGDWDVFEQGTYFHREWFPVVEEAPRGPVVRFWDRAATQGGGDWTVGTKLTLSPEGRWYVLDVVRGQWSSQGNETIIKQTAAEDGRSCYIRMEQEPGSSGKDVIDYYRRRVLVGYSFDGVTSTGDKEQRAIPVSSAAEAGNILMLPGQWNRKWLDELSLFPNGANDDQVDSLSGAFKFLSTLRRARILN